MSVKLPQLGDWITPEWGKQLCHLYKVPAWDLTSNAEDFCAFRFDGISGFRERTAAAILGISEFDVTYKIALAHDLKYAYGPIHAGHEVSRKKADQDFFNDLKTLKSRAVPAKVAYTIVRILGPQCLHQSCSWGFARKMWV
jgi:hypothetical protein